MIKMDATVRGLPKLRRYLKAESKAQKKDLAVAMKVEGFREMKLLKQQIRQGAPGGRRFAPLTFIARFNWRRRRNHPLTRLAIGVRYYIPRKTHPEFHFGWVGPKVSKSWKRLAKMHQEGFTGEITPDMRRWLGKRKESENVPRKYRRYFGIRKQRTHFTTPARPILDPFWRAMKPTAMRNIANNYMRKRRGHRI